MSLTPCIDSCLARSTAGPTFSCPPTSIIHASELLGAFSIHAWTRQSRIVVLIGAVRVASSGVDIDSLLNANENPGAEARDANIRRAHAGERRKGRRSRMDSNIRLAAELPGPTHT